MEVSGVVGRQVSGFFHGEYDAYTSSQYYSGVPVGTRNLRLVGHRNSTALSTSRLQLGVTNSRFCDDGHLQYYVGPRGDWKSEKEKQKRKVEEMKKELKRLRGLSGDLYASSQMCFVLRPDDGLVDELQGKLISVHERTETLIRQLQQLRAEEKELKRKRKLEKAKLKAARERTVTILDSSSSSSSSSESSENEGGGVIDMSYHRREAFSQAFSLAVADGWQTNTVQGSTMTLPSPPSEQCHSAIWDSNLLFDRQNQASNGGSDHKESSSATASYGKRVEVCMGNKCRKAGAAMLLEEFERVLGADGAVCGCKCMGKCRDGPNVRVLNSLDRETGTYHGSDGSATTLADTLCTGVGLEDVGRIVAKFSDQKDSSLLPATKY